MLAKPITTIPQAAIARGEVVGEPKFDGWRALARVDTYGGVSLVTRHGTRLSRAFPELQEALHTYLPPDTIVDAELVRWDPRGRLDFAMVGRRAAASQRAHELAMRWPCSLIVFDLLQLRGQELWREPLAVRRTVMEDVFSGVPATAPVVLTMQSGDLDELSIWRTALPKHGIEGLVFKDVREPYLAGRRRWSKLKHRQTEDGVVAGATGAPASLLLGRYDETGQLRIVGRTMPLAPAASAEIAAAIRPAHGDHPWPARLPAGWVGLYGRREPLRYLQLEPDLVVEVQVDVARTGHRWRHPARYVRIRPDLRPTDVANLECAATREGTDGPWMPGAYKGQCPTRVICLRYSNRRSQKGPPWMCRAVRPTPLATPTSATAAGPADRTSKQSFTASGRPARPPHHAWCKLSTSSPNCRQGSSDA
jgi:ATP-dependent DNA ligase